MKQNINISRSEFLPSLTLEGSHTSSTSSNRTDSSGSALSDTNLDTETKSIIIDQKIFQGFQGYNSLKKSKLEVEKATFELKKVEQEIILDTANVYFNLIFKDKNKNLIYPMLIYSKDKLNSIKRDCKKRSNNLDRSSSIRILF